MPATAKQISYISLLLERIDEAGYLNDVLPEINPDGWNDNEDFMDWVKRQDIRRASEVIDILKDYADRR